MPPKLSLPWQTAQAVDFCLPAAGSPAMAGAAIARVSREVRAAFLMVWLLIKVAAT
jgi:hypothetical protein